MQNRGRIVFFIHKIKKRWGEKYAVLCGGQTVGNIALSTIVYQVRQQLEISLSYTRHFTIFSINFSEYVEFFKKRQVGLKDCM